MEKGEREMALPMKEADDSYLNKENGATVCLTDGSPEMNGSYWGEELRCRDQLRKGVAASERIAGETGRNQEEGAGCCGPGGLVYSYL